MAEKLARELDCQTAQIAPLFKNILILFLISMLKWRVPIRIVGNVRLEDYEEVILFGPVWGGLLISPLRTAIYKCIKAKKKFHFALTCESKEEDKDGKYGYNHVFGMVDIFAGEWVLQKAAFSTSLVKNYVEPTSVTSGKVKITDENYSDELRKKLLDFTKRILAGNEANLIS
ncbi:hypothetical protein [Raineya sp.]|jgi:hypothetical protein